mgnify:CR=1 FL=1
MDLLNRHDFTTVNLGVFIAEKNGNEFVFQRPFDLDQKRKAQNSCILYINNDCKDVLDFDDAIVKANEFLTLLNNGE